MMFSGLRLSLALLTLMIATLACNSDSDSDSGTQATDTGNSFGSSTTPPPPPPYVPVPVPFSMQSPVRLTQEQIDGLDSETGWQNTSNKFIFVNGRIQLFQAKTRCSNADLEVKWAANAPWLRLNHFFVERNAFVETNGFQPGAGMSFATQFFLPAGGRVRINFGTNPDCRDPNNNNLPSGSLYLGGYAEGNIPAEQIFDWSYVTIN